MTREELDKARKKAAKKYKPEQLSKRKFCTKCLDYKGFRQFSRNVNTPDHRAFHCKGCMAKDRKALDLKKRLLANEIYVEGANQIVVDKVVGGRALISKLALAKFLDVNERTISRMKQRGDIPGYNFLGQLYFKKEDVESWLEAQLGEKIELDDKLLS